MERLSKRARCELVIAAGLLLGSCGGASDTAELANARAFEALTKCEALEDRLLDVEDRLGL